MEEPKEKKLEKQAGDNYEREIIKSLYGEWKALIETQSEPLYLEDLGHYRKFSFYIDHRTNPNTSFKGELVECEQFTEPIGNPFPETANKIKQITGKIDEDEQWLTIEVTPKNIYQPKFLWSISPSGTQQGLAIEALRIWLSNTGTGVEETYPGDFPPYDKEKALEEVYLKNPPSLKNVPNIHWVEGQKFDSLQGATLERLKIILHQIKIGNTIDAEDFEKQLGLAENGNG